MNITSFENFLSRELLLECQEVANSVLYIKENRFRTSFAWEKNLSRESSPVLVYELGIENKELFSKLKKEIKDKLNLYLENILIQYWDKLCYLDWHTDANYNSALTIYLNEVWKPHWGGYLLYKEDKDIKGIIPECNLAVLQPGGIPHCVTTINMGSDIRVSLQAFLGTSNKIL